LCRIISEKGKYSKTVTNKVTKHRMLTAEAGNTSSAVKPAPTEANVRY